MPTQVDDVANRLVEAARARMWASGVPSFTVSQVVADAGTSLKSFYRCFTGKDELLVALFEDDARRGAAALGAMVERERSPMARLEVAVVGLFRFITLDGRLPYAAALVREHLRLAESRPDELRTLLTPFVDVFAAELRRAMAAGVVRTGDADRDARTLFHLVLSHLHALICHQIEDEPAVVAGDLWAFCTAALRPAAQGRARTATPARGTDRTPVAARGGRG
ncbi:MAG TPA: TetR/AcrR family transcriptional regulator [Acidimicrobiales bacterium]|nr:TetR/AcrR family transcriptional regulator [Acidimicrobiales bacterium]